MFVGCVDFPTQFTGKADPRQGTGQSCDRGRLDRQPWQRQISIGSQRRKQFARFRTCHDQGAVFGGVIGQGQPVSQRIFQQFEIMPLRRGRSDQGKVIVAMTHHGHFCQDPTPCIREIGKVHTPNFGQATGDLTAQPFGGAVARQVKAAKSGQVQNANSVTHGFAFLADALFPWA
jgi:hypothetical protein